MESQYITCKKCNYKFSTNIEEYIGYNLCPIHYEEFSLSFDKPTSTRECN